MRPQAGEIGVHFILTGFSCAGLATSDGKYPAWFVSCGITSGFYLADAGQNTRAIQLHLGHKNIQHTLATGRFKDFWQD